MLSNETHKTADLNKYTNYLKIIFENWIRLWQFNSNLKLCRLNYDTYINKGRAIKKIVNKMTRKRQRKRKKKKIKNKIEVNKNQKLELNETNLSSLDACGSDK